MKIYVVRHGETDWNRQRHMLGSSDIPLNDYGRQLAEITRGGMKELPIDMAFTSPQVRAKETAEIILRGREVPLIPEDLLREMDFGVHEGRSAIMIEQDPNEPIYNFMFHAERYCPPEKGESFQEVYERSHRFLREKILPLEGVYENVLVVSHGAYILTILNELLGVPMEDFWRYRPENCSVTTLRLENGQFSVEDLDRTYYTERSGF